MGAHFLQLPSTLQPPKELTIYSYLLELDCSIKPISFMPCVDNVRIKTGEWVINKKFDTRARGRGEKRETGRKGKAENNDANVSKVKLSDG
jgi:hypothetical protein